MDWDEDDWEDPLHRAYIQVVDNEGAPAFSFHLPPGLPPLVDDGGAAADQMAIEEGLEPLTCAEVESTLRQRFRALPDARKMALPRSFLNQLFPRPSGEQEKETPEEKPGEEEEEEEEKSQRYARAPPPPVSKRWLVGALRWLFLASQDDPQAGLAWLSTTATQPGERHEGGDVERTEEWCLMASAVLGHIESSMHDLYASPKLTNEYIARHTDLLADTEQLASWIKRACQAQRAEVLPYLLRCLSALGCAHARRVPQGEDRYVQLVLECIQAPLQPTNKPTVITAGLNYLGMPRSGFVNEILQETLDEFEQSIINLIDHPEIQVRTALLPLLCSHRYDLSDAVLLKRLASLKDETHLSILTQTLSALSQALSLDRLIDHSQDLFEVAMRALGHEDRKVVYSAAELLELSLDYYDAELDRNASEALVWLVRALVDVVWKPRAIKSLLALSVKCVRANLDKLKPLVPVLPHELQQRINPLEFKIHDTLGVGDQKLWWSRPHDAATHCLNVLITAYPHCFTELARIVDEYLEPEQPWRKREVGLFLLQCARDEGEYNDMESVEELMAWAEGHLPLVVASLSHPHPQIRKVSCLTIERTYARDVDDYTEEVLDALWRIASDDPVDVAEAAVSCINELFGAGSLSLFTYDEGLERLVAICRKRPPLAEQLVRTMIGLIPLRVAPDVWIPTVVPLCLELIETSQDADTLRSTFECLAEVLLYNAKSIATGLGGHKEAITQLLERFSARPEDHARGVRLMDALQRANVDLSLFASPDAIVAFAASVLQSQRPSVHKLSHLLDHMTMKHPEAVQRALPQLVPAVVAAIYHTHYDPSKWYHMFASINEWLHSFSEDMTPHIESLSACLARVSPAIVSDKYRAAMVNAIGLMGFRHAHLVSPVVLRVFPANWLRSAHIFGIKYPDPSWRNRAPGSPPLPWEEAAEGLANVIERLCTSATTDNDASDASSESRYTAPVALAALIKEVLDTMRSLGALQGALSPRLRERLAAVVAAVTGGWSHKQQKAFVRQYWAEESNDREDYKELLREFLPDIHPLVVLLNLK